MKRSTFRSAFFSPRVLIALLLCAAGWLFDSKRDIAGVFPARSAEKRCAKNTNSEERVAYQRAIEEVYWRHRIWPKERLGSKPVIGCGDLSGANGKESQDYLRKSQALEDYWQRPITAQQLQAEMDRMAPHTRQSEVLAGTF